MNNNNREDILILLISSFCRHQSQDKENTIAVDKVLSFISCAKVHDIEGIHERMFEIADSLAHALNTQENSPLYAPMRYIDVVGGNVVRNENGKWIVDSCTVIDQMANYIWRSK